jgi:cystathionine beta-lyase
LSRHHNGLRPETRIVHSAEGAGNYLAAETVGPATQRASTVLVPDAASLYDPHRPTYGRQGLASQKSMARAMCELEGASFCQLYSSGLAAVTHTLLSVLKSGDTILVTDGIYDPVRSFCKTVLIRFGVTTIYYPADASVDEIMALATPQTTALLIESPASLTFEMVDVAALASACRARGVICLMDNTWGAGLSFKPLAHGVDISIQALTKYVCGHSDVFLGAACTNDEKLADQIYVTQKFAGFHVSPDDAYQGLKGLRTLPVRYAHHGQSGLTVARWLQHRPEVARVIHPALPGDAGHALWKRDYTGACGLFSFELKDTIKDKAEAFLNALELFGLGFSWGGFESLAILCRPERTARPAKTGPIVRLHVGLEAPEDLIADLEQAFETLKA